MDITSPSTTIGARPGKSAMAVGHMAKAAVAEAKAAGADLPKNAQGLAASSIARGAEPGSVFQPYLPPPPVPQDAGPVDAPTDAGDDVAAPTDDTTPEAVAAAAAEGYAVSSASIGVDPALTEAETALKLITDSLDATL